MQQQEMNKRNLNPDGIPYQGMWTPAPNPVDQMLAFNPKYNELLEMKLEISFGLNMAIKSGQLW